MISAAFYNIFFVKVISKKQIVAIKRYWSTEQSRIKNVTESHLTSYIVVNTASAWPQLDISPCSYQSWYMWFSYTFDSTLFDSILFYSRDLFWFGLGFGIGIKIMTFYLIE